MNRRDRGWWALTAGEGVLWTPLAAYIAWGGPSWPYWVGGAAALLVRKVRADRSRRHAERAGAVPEGSGPRVENQR